METKKNPKFDLEPKRKTFFFFGLVISLMLVLFAFKSTKEVEEIYIPESPTGIDIDEIYCPPVTVPPKLPPPPPPMKIFNFIEIVENNIETPETGFIFEELYDPLPLPYQEEEEIVDNTIFLFPQQLPEFPGGMKSLNSWLSRNIKYPYRAQELNLSGRVFLNFIVDKDGSISDVKVTRSVDDMLDQEAIRVISSMPKWNPGQQNGKPVRVSYNIFVTFKLN